MLKFGLRSFHNAPARGAVRRFLPLSLLVLGALPLCAQNQVIPQVADGQGWSTTIALVNRTAAAKSVALSFHRSTSDGATEPWTPPFVESVSLNSISLAAGSAVFLHTRGDVNAPLSQGWAELSGADGVAGYAIYTARSAGSAAQDATAPAVLPASRILVPFDNTSGLVSAIAIVNPNAAPETVSVNLRTSDGTTITGTLPTLPANGQLAFLMRDVFPETRGKQGLAEFYVASGSFSMIALRARDVGAFTSAPVYAQTGPPVLSGSGGGLAASDPRYQVIPQVADGNGWSTAIVLTNTTTSDQQVSLTFRMAVPQGGGATQTWSPDFLENIPLSALTIPAGSTLFLHTRGTAGELSQGWAELAANSGVEGYAVFTSQAPGASPQDSTAPAVSASGRILVPFDNSSPGLVTAVAAVNPTGAVESVSVNIRTNDGATSTATVSLPAQGQIAFLMPDRFNATTGKSGLAEFYVASGRLSFIGLRGNGSAITSAPVYFETGSPIITSGGSNGGGNTGTGTTPTQAEIDSWISRGSYTAGTISLNRSTAYTTISLPGVPAAATPTKSDEFSAQFARYGGADLPKMLRGELPPGFPNMVPAIGSCVVYNLNNITIPYPNVTATALDAGPRITSTGPNGAINADRQSSPAGFTYDAANVPNTYLAAGRYTLAGTGGSDVGAFSGNLDIAQEFVVTSNPDDFKVINRGAGVTVRWTGGDPSTIATISGSSVSITGGAAGASAFVCLQNVSAGQFTVPSSILSQLPASVTVGGIALPGGSFSVSASGKGVRLNSPSGLDILTVNNSWDWSFTPQYQ